MTFVGLLATDAGFSDFLSGEGNLKVQSVHELGLCGISSSALAIYVKSVLLYLVNMCFIWCINLSLISGEKKRNSFVAKLQQNGLKHLREKEKKSLL